MIVSYNDIKNLKGMSIESKFKNIVEVIEQNGITDIICNNHYQYRLQMQNDCQK